MGATALVVQPVWCDRGVEVQRFTGNTYVQSQNRGLGTRLLI